MAGGAVFAEELDGRARPPRGRPRVLVVEDETDLQFMLTVMLSRLGYEAVTASDGLDALAVLEREPELRVVLCDLKMPRLDGLGFLDRVRGRGLRVLMMSAYGTAETAREALDRGAADYISKPFQQPEIRVRLQQIFDQVRLLDENRRLRDEVSERWTLEGFMGRSPGAAAVMESVRKVAAYPTTVLLTGESGTGKELLARALHACSPRASLPFIAVNCAAIPEPLLESELFGHERGAFTGAVRAHAGLFERAHTGTLLLDEIGDMPVILQSRLLRVLEDGRVRRVGGTRDIEVDVRVVAATAQELEAAVADGRFREDLFYRLNVVRIHIPPLRERREDLDLLVPELISRAALRLGLPAPALSPEAFAALEAYSWPGNVRQLEHALERAVVLSQGGEIRAADLPLELTQRPAAPAQAATPLPPDQVDLSIPGNVAILERELIVRALQRTAGNRTQAARLLEISYKALLYKIRDYRIEI